MRMEDTPFRAGWWGTDLEGVGLREQRPLVGTYGCYDFAFLPPLPYRLTGEFDWLAQAPPHLRNIGEERSKENAEAFVRLRLASEAKGIRGTYI